MNREVATELFGACERALAELTAVEAAIGKIEDADERRALLLPLSGVIVEVLSRLRAPAVSQYPDLEPPPQLGDPDTLLDHEAQLVTSKLSPDQVSFIDQALLAECAQSWRKVARVVGSAMGALGAELEGVPDGYFAQRVIALVEAGLLESQGNLQYMRYSEVRLSQSE